MSGDGSGPASRRAWPVRTLRLRPACRRLSEQDGSERRAACHQRYLDDRRSLSGRYLSLAERKEILHARGAGARDSPADGALGVDDLAGAATQCRDAQRGPGLSCNHSAVACRLGGPARNQPGWRSTGRCARMCRIDWLARSSRQRGLQLPGLQCLGKVVDTDLGRIGGGHWPGVRSRLLAAYRSTFPTMRRCASVTRPSTNRFTYKAVEPCAAS